MTKWRQTGVRGCFNIWNQQVWKYGYLLLIEAPKSELWWPDLSQRLSTSLIYGKSENSTTWPPTYFFSTRHFVKSINKRLFKSFKLVSCPNLKLWQKSVSNMIWWSISSSLGKPSNFIQISCWKKWSEINFWFEKQEWNNISVMR